MLPFVYCPFCRATLQARHIPAPDGPERRVCGACGFVQWGNSKPTASGIVVEDQTGRVLLGRRAIEPFKNAWDIPGGFLESGEHPEACVVRELREETGLEVRVTRLVGVYTDTYGPPPSEDTLNFYYECRVIGGTLKADDDVSELDWFDPQDVSEPLAFNNTQQAFADWSKR